MSTRPHETKTNTMERQKPISKPENAEPTKDVVGGDVPPLVRHLWVQYAYEDTLNAPIIQTADTEEEAREENETVMSGCCWYRYEVISGERDGKLVNGNGPHYLTNV